MTAFFIEHAPWILLGCLALFALHLSGNIRRSEKEEREQQSAVAEARVVGFLDADGRLFHEPVLYPGHGEDIRTLVVYEFQPDAHSAAVRGQDWAFQHELARLAAGARVRVRFNPRLPALSRLDDRVNQPFAMPMAHSIAPTSAEAMSRRRDFIFVAVVACWWVALLFPGRKFVPSTTTVVGAIVVACILAAWIFLLSRKVPARLPETRSSRIVTLWVRPPVYAMVALFAVTPFLGNALPSALTRAVGERGEATLTASGHEVLFKGNRRQLQVDCSKTEFASIPAYLTGDEVLCRPFGSSLPKGTQVRLRGQRTFLGIAVEEAVW